MQRSEVWPRNLFVSVYTGEGQDTKLKRKTPHPHPLPPPFLTMIKILGLLRSPLTGSCSCKNRHENKTFTIWTFYRWVLLSATDPTHGEESFFSPTIPCSNQFFTWNMADRCKMWLKWLVCIFLYFLEVFGE